MINKAAILVVFAVTSGALIWGLDQLTGYHVMPDVSPVAWIAHTAATYVIGGLLAVWWIKY